MKIITIQCWTHKDGSRWVEFYRPKDEIYGAHPTGDVMVIATDKGVELSMGGNDDLYAGGCSIDQAKRLHWMLGAGLEVATLFDVFWRDPQAFHFATQIEGCEIQFSAD